MKLVVVNVLKDNYCYLVWDENHPDQCILVDNGVSETVLQAASQHGVKISTVLITHHHWDHAGGNEDLQKQIPDVKIYGEQNVKALTNLLKGGESWNVGSLKITAHHTPYHTKGHICYEIVDQNDKSQKSNLFTGDTLFLAGAGRFFEGTAEEAYDSLYKKIRDHFNPNTTEIYCGHNYAVHLLTYALVVFGSSHEKTKSKLEWAKKQDELKQPTVPSTLAEEIEYNPFLRGDKEDVAKFVGLPVGSNPIEVVRALRAHKDSWKM